MFYRFSPSGRFSVYDCYQRTVICEQIEMFTFKITNALWTYQWVIIQHHALKMNNMGLTEIPTNIPCTETRIQFNNNYITRIERDSFKCLSAAFQVSMKNNNLSYINQEAFHPLKSLGVLILSNNLHLDHLPADFGPAASNLVNLRIQNINLQSLPANFFQQFGAMRHSAPWVGGWPKPMTTFSAVW